MDAYVEVVRTDDGVRVFFDPHQDADLRAAERQITKAIEQQEDRECSSS